MPQASRNQSPFKPSGDELRAQMPSPSLATASGDTGRRCSFLELTPPFFDGARVVHFEDHGWCLPIVDRGCSSQSTVPDASSSQPDAVVQGSLNRWACNTCSALEFFSLDEQRCHFKSDFHRFNVKRKLVGKDPISEEGFELLTQGQHQKDNYDQDLSSISGSGEEDSDSSNEEDSTHSRSFPVSKSLSYISVMLPSSGEIATFWKCVVSRDNERIINQQGSSGIGSKDTVSEEALVKRLKDFVSRNSPKENNEWLILLLRGGHFAGCVLDCRNGSILAHKTHHRYVVRAKAGGKQSTKDGSGRAPKSAGASLRRHNEASLHREIRDLLASWKVYLEAATCIFVHAPSRNGNVLFGGEHPPLIRTDNRVRNIPITTRRPTFKEAKRIFNELITISFHSIESTGVPDSASSQEPRKRQIMKENSNLVTKEQVEEIRCAESSKFSDREKMEHFISINEKVLVNVNEKVLVNVNEGDSSQLHDAARLGKVDLVLELLETGADPCVKDHRGQTPYNLASDKETRNAFRKFMAANLERWDWHTANVPSPLTDEMEAAQAEKEAKWKAKVKEQKKIRKAKLKAREVAASSLEKTIPEKSVNLTPDADQLKLQNEKRNAEDIEREKRALAAERRMKALSLASANGNNNSPIKGNSPCCSYCGLSLLGMTPFYRLSFQYCSTVCVRSHRQALEDEQQ